MTATFLPGLELSADYYREVIGPLLGDRPHAAALLGYGSDVLGYDTARSTDHGWGPRLQLFVLEGHTADDGIAAISDLIDRGLPAEFRGWPTQFGWDAVPVSHHITVTTLGDWLVGELGFDPRASMGVTDWLVTPQQLLLEVTAGRVHADPTGELAAVRDALAYFPRDVWLWILACQWQRINQEEPFVGRTAEVGDDLGSRIVAMRQVRELMRLAFLLERTYWPYTKWFGAAFGRLDCAVELQPMLAAVTASTDHRTREAALVKAYETVARQHNAAAVTPPVDPAVQLFHGRPFRVLNSDRFVQACLAEVSDEWLHNEPLVGSVDQFVDSTDVTSGSGTVRRLREIYTR